MDMGDVIRSIAVVFIIITMFNVSHSNKRYGREIEKYHLREKINNALKDAKVLMNGEHMLAAKVTFKDGKPDVDSIEFVPLEEYPDRCGGELH